MSILKVPGLITSHTFSKEKNLINKCFKKQRVLFYFSKEDKRKYCFNTLLVDVLLSYMDMVISNFLKFLIKGETYPGKKQMIEIHI